MTAATSASSLSRHILFLQGPITPFFKLIADQLESQGCRCFRINLCFGDWLFWRGRDSTEYRGAQRDWPAFIENYIHEHSITDIVLLGEQRYYHKVAIELAQRNGIQVVSTDFGYLRPDWITFEKNGMSANSDFPRTAEAIFALAENLPEPDLGQRFRDSFVRQVYWDIQYHLLSTIMRPLYPGYRSHQLHHPVFVYLGTGLRLLKLKLFGAARADRAIEKLIAAGRPYMVFPLQMQNDFQIRAYSQYENLEQAIDEVLASFAANADPAMQLAIKIHPLDPGMQPWRRICHRVAARYGVAERVVFVDGGSLERLIAHSAGVVTINSTVGIWALRQARPTHVLGESVYKIEGLVSSGELDGFWQSPTVPDPNLLQAFIRALVATIHIRGVYYHQPGLDHAVAQAADRLINNQINQPRSDLCS